MLRIDVLLGDQGVLSQLVAEGHAGFSIVGQDVVCSAATVLLRTTGRVLERAPQVEVAGEATKEGSLTVKVEKVLPEGITWLKGVTDSLLTGLSDLAREFPNHINVVIR